MTHTQLPETVNKPPEKTSRDVFISGVVGLLGGPLGAPLSIGSYLLWRKVGLQGAARWFAWAATGFIGAPLSLAMIAAILPHPPANQATASSSTSSQHTKADRSAAKNQEDIKVGELQTKDFSYSNIQIAPYTIKNSFAAQQANIAGKLYEITADVTNLSKESKAPQLFNIEVTDSQGRTFKEADGMVRFGDIEKGHSATDFVLPGQTRQTVRLALIDASPDATDFSLKVGAEIFGGVKVVKPIQSSSAEPESAKLATRPSAEPESIEPPPQPSSPPETIKTSPRPTPVSESNELEKPGSPPSGFNAEIFDSPTNCRSGSGKANSVVKVFSNGPILVDQKNPQADTQGSLWFKELYQNCWVHESQLKFK
jgi:hypothetical protein